MSDSVPGKGLPHVRSNLIKNSKMELKLKFSYFWGEKNSFLLDFQPSDHPDDPSIILEPQNQEIGEFYEVKERR